MADSLWDSPHCDGRTGVVIGSGPSLVDFPFEDLAGQQFYTIAINQEAFRNQDRYQANAWIYWDSPVGARRYRQDLPGHLRVFTNRKNWQMAVVHRASWARQIRCLYGRRFPNGWDWTKQDCIVPMFRTTASAAVGVLVKMGFKKIILIGVDMFGSTGSGYYYTGENKLGTPRKPFKGSDADQYQVPSNRAMLSDMESIHKGLSYATSRWDGRIIQASIKSPLSCFPKMPWRSAVLA